MLKTSYGRERKGHVIIQLNPANPVGGGGGDVRWISRDRDARRIFLGLKVWISGRKILASTFLGSLI